MQVPRRAFTLIELLVVISIVALLISLLLPAVKKARKIARVTQCASNLRGYALGMTVWATDDAEGKYPPSPYDHFYPSMAWALSFEQYGLDKQSHLSRFTESVMGNNPSVFWCPLDVDIAPIVQGDPSNWFIRLHGSGHDPDYPGYWYDHRGYDVYWTGYIRLGGYIEFSTVGVPAYDFTNSGNAYEGAPSSPDDGPAVIAFDRITSEYLLWSGVHQEDPNDLYNYSGNNVAYTDGHVETHRHKVDDTQFIPHWEDHYVKRVEQFLLY
ncbi:MAG: hypothetical protein CMJ18_12650 [Phycisphaeraceae bacterium]|nr:hypothetical protein [Phycisphaeraceae bacterium]